MKMISIFLLIALFTSTKELNTIPDFETTLQQSDFAGYVIYDATSSPSGQYLFMVSESFKGDVKALALPENDLETDIEHGEEYLLICNKSGRNVTKVHYLLSKVNTLPKSSIEVLNSLPCYSELQEKEHEAGFCTKQLDPVCGCDNKTYGNLCFLIKAGMLKFKAGRCL